MFPEFSEIYSGLSRFLGYQNFIWQIFSWAVIVLVLDCHMFKNLLEIIRHRLIVHYVDWCKEGAWHRVQRKFVASDVDDFKGGRLVLAIGSFLCSSMCNSTHWQLSCRNAFTNIRQVHPVQRGTSTSVLIVWLYRLWRYSSCWLGLASKFWIILECNIVRNSQ